jgi:hypothetical protein
VSVVVLGVGAQPVSAVLREYLLIRISCPRVRTGPAPILVLDVRARALGRVVGRFVQLFRVRPIV